MTSQAKPQTGEPAEPPKALPFLDPTDELEVIWEDVQARIAEVLRSGRFILGPNVQAFEKEVADYLGVRHAIGLNSGTDALILGLRAIGVAPGDEVITSPFTFVATAGAIELVGAKPVFVDIDPRTFNLDVEHIEAAITPRTKAIIPVHLFGQMADMTALEDVARRHSLRVLEDAAQALGAKLGGRRAGTIGDAGTFSFFPTKNLGACGDAGLLATNDDAVGEQVKLLRAHGSRKKYQPEVVGYNSRLDEMQAAILRAKLPHLDFWNERRRERAARYDALLGNCEWIETPYAAPHATHIFHQYTVRVAGDRRDLVQSALRNSGVATMVYYPTPLHRSEAYGDPELSLPEAERAAREVLSLPIWPFLDADAQERVAEALLMETA